MKFAFLTTGLVASMFAFPWFPAQEPNPGTSPATSQKINEARSPLPTGYTERTRYEYDYSGGSGALPALPPRGQMPLTPATPATPDQGNGAFNSSGMIAAWEMENGNWVLKYQPIEKAELATAYRQAYQAYQSAADDEAKNKASADLKANLEKQYDLFVEGQAKQIEELEKRLAKLREQLDKRRGAKERVVELKLQMVLSQAEGLGFPDNGYPNGANMFGQNLYQVPGPLAGYPDNPAATVPGLLLPPAPIPPQVTVPLQTNLPATDPAREFPRVEGGGGQNKKD
jgi:hypothetical protein